jgi:hypothetical protein
VLRVAGIRPQARGEPEKSDISTCPRLGAADGDGETNGGAVDEFIAGELRRAEETIRFIRADAEHPSYA